MEVKQTPFTPSTLVLLCALLPGHRLMHLLSQAEITGMLLYGTWYRRPHRGKEIVTTTTIGTHKNWSHLQGSIS